MSRGLGFLSAVGSLSIAATLAACGAESWSFDEDAGAKGPDADEVPGNDARVGEDSAADVSVSVPDATGDDEAAPEAGPVLEAAPTCSADAQCPDDAPVCNQPAGMCTRCSANLDCAGAAGGPVCDGSTGRCVQCTSKSDCSASPALPYCDTSSNACVQCLTTTDCGREAFCQPTSHTCVSMI